eukprot:3941217-Rhodomonas_salina.5
MSKKKAMRILVCNAATLVPTHQSPVFSMSMSYACPGKRHLVWHWPFLLNREPGLEAPSCHALHALLPTFLGVGRACPYERPPY